MQEKNKRKFDDIKLRLLQFAESQGIPKMDFYKKISVPQSNFGGKSMESSLSSSKITEILIIFPQINPDWLLMGNGEMLRTAEASTAAPETANSNVTTLINILNNTLAEKDKQIDRLLSIIEKNNLNK